MSHFAPYIPIDRRFALAEGRELPDRAAGTALFADLSGFTQLTTRLLEALGRKRGAEEILPLLNRIYSKVVFAINEYQGSVINFSGDAVTCWFDQDSGQRALSAAAVIQKEIDQFGSLTVPGGFTASISVKISIASGTVRRFIVGSPQHMLSDVLAGSLVDQVAHGERLAGRGEILVSEGVAESITHMLRIDEWRESKNGYRFAVVEEILETAPRKSWPPSKPVRDEVAAQFVLPTVAERLRKGEGHYLAAIRPATALFVQFGGLDYDGDDRAGEKLNRYVQWVQEVIEQYEGVLLQLTIGDKGAYFFLGFGAPIAHADDASRAVASALILRKVPVELNFIKEVKIGIAQGQMRTGAYGGEDRLAYGVLGDKVNRAARLMNYAPQGEIYCDESIYVTIRDAWQTEIVSAETEERELKNTVPMGVIYRLTGEVLRQRQLSELQRNLVGREDELSLLIQTLNGAVSGEPGSIWLTGEAGIGKSHLISALAGKATQDGFFVLEGTASSIEQQTPYWAWRSILNQYFDWEEERAGEGRLGQVQSIVDRMSTESQARLPVLNDIAYLGIPENDLTRSLPKQLRLDNVVLLIADLLRIRSQNQPLLLILEDVHWMDDLSWQLSYRVGKLLMEWRERVVVVWTTRPRPDPVAHSQVESVRSLVGSHEISLLRMPTNDVRHLISLDLDIGEDLIPEAIETLVQDRAEGNPFYALELLKTLKEERLIWYLGAESESPWQVADDFHLAASALPDTLQGLLLARIDRLSLDQQTVLKVASVIGRTFEQSALSHVVLAYAEGAHKRLSNHLRALSGGDLIRMESEVKYEFNHILTRDTTYQTLLYAQRRQLHEIVAGWYEGHYINEALAPYYPTLAYHYLQAEKLEMEYRYVCLSADQAAQRYANRQALDYLARALELTGEYTEQYKIRLQREEILGLIGDRAGQADELDHLDNLCRAHYDEGWTAEVTIRFAQFQRLTGDYDQAMINADRVIQIGERTSDELILARGAHIKGQIYVQQSNYADASGYFEAALQSYLNQGVDEKIAEVYGDYGVLEVYQGDFQGAVPYFEHAINIYRSINNRREAARNQLNLAGAYGYLTEIEKAIEYYLESYEINREIGETRNAHIAQGNLGAAYLDSGDYGLALQHLHKALITSRAIGDLRKEGTWLGNLGEIALEIGRLDEAIEYFQQALRISKDIGNKNGQGMWLNRLGEANRLSGYLDDARRFRERGLSINREIGNQNEIAFSINSHGMALIDMDQWRDALEAFTDVYKIRERLNQVVSRTNQIPGIAFALLKQNQALEAAQRLDEFWNAWNSYTDQQKAEIDLWALYAAVQIYDAVDDKRGPNLLNEAHRLLTERAERISDPAMRKEFLESVVVNKEIRTRYEEDHAIV